jgi:hypothetical protein
MAEYMRADLPAPLKPVFPYALAANLTMGSSGQYITLIHHEAAHAYQGMRAPEKLAAAERANLALDKRYPYEDEPFAAAWQAELDCLRDAVQAETEADARAQVARFLELRRSRRANLAADFANLERQREWEEGFAKYVEMTAYRLAATTPGYTPVPEITSDPQFHHYSDFPTRRRNEINQISLSGRQPDEIRFYYAGWAQSELLDRLAPGWKARLFEEGIWLEDLLAEAIE